MTDADAQTYTKDEVRSAVERELLRHRVANLEQIITALREALADLRVAIGGVEKSLREHNQASALDRAGLRAEIEEGFVTKLAFQEKFSELEKKFDRMWVRASTATTVAVLVLELVLKYGLK